ncbi:hypothetical protein BGZ81_001814 [Podila clonocystis]|nr:hypothetical protein BGZ81_001814 [Podila clonocystis]
MSFLRKNPPVRPHSALSRPVPSKTTGGGTGGANKRVIEKPVAQPAPGTFTDYKLVSTSHDVLHHVMRFHGNKDVNPASFSAPVKLHRKRNENQYYRNYSNYYNNKYNKGAQGATGASAGDDKKGGAAAPGAPGAPATGADTSLIAPYGGGVRNKQMLFKKKTRQIYIANEDERKKKEIESAPWVIEDYDSQNNFTGQLEGGQHANYVLFVFSDDGFKVVPADKWYKFSPKLQYATLTAEEAEEQYQKSAKANNSNRWLMRSKLKAKTEDGEEIGEEDADGDQFMAVDHDDDVGYDEDEAKERKRKRGKHGDVDEMDFDEVWQDDEEAPSEMPGFDDDDKDDPRKKMGPSMDSDEDDDDEDDSKLTEAGREIKKALLKLEKNKVYADDDDRDPYASDKDSSDSDLDEIDKDKEAKKEEEATSLALEQAKSKKKAAAKGVPLIAKKADTTKKPTKPVSAKALKGAKIPMPAPRTTTTAANGKGLKPTAPSSGARSASPPAVASSSSDKKKRKLDGDDTAEDGSAKKSARSADASASPATSEPADDSMLITEAEVIALLKSRPTVTTRDVISDLKRKLRKDARNKGVLAQIVKKVASSHEGVLTLKEGY